MYREAPFPKLSKAARSTPIKELVLVPMVSGGEGGWGPGPPPWPRPAILANCSKVHV